MATEKFFVFNESGTLKRLKGRIVRFLDNEDPDNTDKTNIRASISVPASAEGLTPVNNLSDVSSVSTSRDNLGVPSDDEMAEATGTKLVGPALYFDGSSSYVEVADDAKLSFTDGTDDLPFSVSAWVKADSFASVWLLSKYLNSATREYLFSVGSSGDLRLSLYTDASNSMFVETTSDLSSYNGKWIHVVATYGGSGPNSGTAFASAGDAISLYVNGASVSVDVPSYTGTYAGMSDTSQPIWLGRQSTSHSKQHIKDVKIFNRELTATEVAQLARGVDLGFADEYGGAFGSPYTADWSSTTDSWANSNTTLSQASGPVGGRSNVLQITANSGSSTHAGKRTISGVTVGKRYRVVFDYYLDAGNSHADGIKARFDNGTYQALSAVSGAWTRYEFEVVATANILEVYMFDGASQTFDDTGGDDNLWLDNLTVTEIGTLADFRAENYDSDTGKIYDLSDNAFVGVNNGATLTGRAYPVYETGTWTPSLYFSGTSAATYSDQSGYYTRIGNTVYVRGSISVSGVGASSGSVSVAGLPFQPSSDGASSSIAGCYMASAANLTSQPIGLVYDGVSLIDLYDAGATGNTALDETNITASTVIKVSATYQIQ